MDKENPNFNLLLDPKAAWALKNLHLFPKEINTCSYNELLQIPGVGVKGAKKIYSSRKYFKIKFEDLKNMNIVMKRAKYFMDSANFKRNIIEQSLLLEDTIENRRQVSQLSLFNE